MGTSWDVMACNGNGCGRPTYFDTSTDILIPSLDTPVNRSKAIAISACP